MFVRLVDSNTERLTRVRAEILHFYSFSYTEMMMMMMMVMAITMPGLHEICRFRMCVEANGKRQAYACYFYSKMIENNFDGVLVFWARFVLASIDNSVFGSGLVL